MKLNKNEAINLLINKVYENNSNLVLSEDDIRKLNKFFKESIQFDEDFDKYFLEHQEELSGITKLKSGKYEMEKQYKNNKALQPGILSECNYIETLAKIFKLNKCLDFDRTPINKVPLECRKYLEPGYQSFSAARYLYYSSKQPNIFIFHL